ncbi:MAG: VanW family protein [Eggerthellaceae bacterium]|nr:VanW family protein [Eggerthellaceae bacterium]
MDRYESPQQQTNIENSASASRYRSATQLKRAATPRQSVSAADEKDPRRAQGKKSSAKKSTQAKGNQKPKKKPVQNVNGQAAVVKKKKKSKRKKNGPAFLSNKKFRFIAAIIICLVLITGIDYFIHRDKIFGGITVGKVDVSGMTVEEAATSISDAYSTQISDKTITILAGEALNSLETENPTPDQLFALVESFEDYEDEDEAEQLLKQWNTNSTELDASIAAQGLAEEAYEKGRSDGFIFKRIFASLFGIDIEPRMTISEKGIEAFASAIDHSIGSPHVDSDIYIDDGVAYVEAGTDGMEINRDSFTKKLETSFLDEGTDNPIFAVKAVNTPQRISQEKAQAVCDRVNASIANGCIFYYFGVGWEVKPTLLGSWITTSIEKDGSSWELVPYVNANWARSAILAQTRTWGDQTPVRIQFTKDNGKLEVLTDGSFKIPLIDDAISELTKELFESSSAPSEAPQITIEYIQAPEQMDFEDAYKTGVIGVISTYTTEYTNEISDEARNHNIHLMGDLLNNSIVRADGGTWSFHETAGESNAEAGFVGAGIILDGEYTEDVGGGICQTATTVFNAVYEAGYPILVRHNHSLYIASYPAGRDAAVNYPDLDLEWENDSTSDVLLTTSYTDTTFTCTLYGVSPGYIVKSEVGDWEEGEKAETQEVKDPTLAPGEKVVKQKPADGRKITVIRRVYNVDGELVSEDYFRSTYDAKNEIVLVGPEA